MFSIGVYVTSRYSAYNTFSEYMDGCIKKFLPVGKPSALVTGDYKSTNSGNGLVARYAFEHNIPLRRFATLWGKHNPSKSGKRNNAGVASNAQIIKNSNGCVLFWTPTSIAKWDFMSGGCRSFLRMCDAGHLSRPLIKIKVDIYAPDIELPAANIPNEHPSMDVDMGAGNIGGGAAPVGDIGGLSIPSGGGSAPAPVGSGGGGSIPNIGHDLTSAVSPIDNAPSDLDSVGNIDGGNNAKPNTVDNIISQMPIDTNGDGVADTNANVIDTDGNGTPDATIKPVDSDNNGTIDRLELEPIPTADQIIAQNSNAQQTPPADNNQTTQTPQPTAPDTEEQKNNAPQ